MQLPRTSPENTPVSTRAIVLREVFVRRRRIFGLALGNLLHGAGHAALALLGGAFVVALGGDHPVGTRSTIVVPHDPTMLAFLAIAASGARLAGATLASWLSARTSGDVSTALRGHVLSALFAVHGLRRTRHRDHGRPCAQEEPDDAISPIGEHGRAVGALTLRVREVTNAVESALVATRAALQLSLLAAVVLFVAPRLLFFAALVLTPFFVVLGRVRARLKSAHRAEVQGAEALLEAADEAVRHADVWRAYGATARVRHHLEHLGHEARDRTARLAALGTAQSGANELLGVIAVALALTLLAKLSPTDAASFAPFAVPFFFAYRPLRDLAEARLSLARAGAAAQDLDDVLVHAAASSRTTDDVAPPAGEPGHGWPLAPLTMTGLSHAHAVWSPLSITIEPGAIVAIVGPTGCGKSTLLRVLLGLEPAAAGHVQYAGISLDTAGLGPQARPFAWVPQDAPVLAASLDENVTLGGDADPRALLGAIGATRLLALGEERLGDGRRTLSGGERQWLSIARALATHQPVLLFDEPTAGLDPDAERAVLDALQRLRGTRTILIVTHRDAPAKIADRILRFGSADDHLGGRSVDATTGLGAHLKLSSKTLEL